MSLVTNPPTPPKRHIYTNRCNRNVQVTNENNNNRETTNVKGRSSNLIDDVKTNGFNGVDLRLQDKCNTSTNKSDNVNNAKNNNNDVISYLKTKHLNLPPVNNTSSDSSYDFASINSQSSPPDLLKAAISNEQSYTPQINNAELNHFEPDILSLTKSIDYWPDNDTFFLLPDSVLNMDAADFRADLSLLDPVLSASLPEWDTVSSSEKLQSDSSRSSVRSKSKLNSSRMGNRTEHRKRAKSGGRVLGKTLSESSGVTLLHSHRGLTVSSAGRGTIVIGAHFFTFLLNC